MKVQMQTITHKRKYSTIQDSSPKDTFVDDAETIYCPADVQELIEEMFPQIADMLCFKSDYEAETKRYYAKKKQSCNAEHPAQQIDADMLGYLADRL